MQVRLYMEKEMTDVQPDFRKSEGRLTLLLRYFEKSKEYQKVVRIYFILS